MQEVRPTSLCVWNESGKLGAYMVAGNPADRYLIEEPPFEQNPMGEVKPVDMIGTPPTGTSRLTPGNYSDM